MFSVRAMSAALFAGGCATTTVTYVTPWLREVSRHEPSFDSGGRVHRSFERRDARGWSQFPHAQGAVVLDGGRVAVRTDADGILIVSENGVSEDVPSCAGRAAVLSPDRRRLVCFERGAFAVGFVGDVFYAIGDTAVTANDRQCRLIEVDAKGRTTTTPSTVHWPPDDCWDTLRRSIVHDEAQLVNAILGP
jgi:hypothetical protein